MKLQRTTRLIQVGPIIYARAGRVWRLSIFGLALARCVGPYLKVLA